MIWRCAQRLTASGIQSEGWSARPSQSLVCAQRLTASGIQSGRRRLPTLFHRGSSAQRLTASGIQSEYNPVPWDCQVLCSTPYGIWYPIRPFCGSTRAAANACSTPYGIWYPIRYETPMRRRRRRSAQRLTASGIQSASSFSQARIAFEVLNALRHLVSNQLQDVRLVGQTMGVLNALRHLVSNQLSYGIHNSSSR